MNMLDIVIWILCDIHDVWEFVSWNKYAKHCSLSEVYFDIDDVSDVASDTTLRWIGIITPTDFFSFQELWQELQSILAHLINCKVH
jgi:hypothetical protein